MRVFLPILLFALLVSGCDRHDMPLRVGTNVWPGYELLYLAREQGYYDDRIRLVELTSASDVMDALRLEQLEAGALTLDEVLSLVQEGHDLVVVLVFNMSVGADVLLVRPDIRQLADLRHRTIALETTAVGALMLHGALDMAGLTPADVRLQHLALTDHLRAYQSGQADAVITFEPYTSALLAAGAQVRFDSSAIPGQIVDVLAVRRDAVERHEHNLRQLLSGFFHARDNLLQQPDTALPIINQRLKMPLHELPTAFSGLQLPGIADNHQLLDDHPSPLEKQAGELATLMHHHKLLPAVPPLPSLTSAHWLPEAP